MGMENESAADMLRQHMATWNILTDDMQGSSAAGQAGSEGGDGDGSSAAGQAGAAAGEGDGSRAAGQAGTAAGDYGDVPGEGESEGDGPGGPMSMMETDAVTIFHVQVIGVPVLGTVYVEVETASEDEETAILDMVKRNVQQRLWEVGVTQIRRSDWALFNRVRATPWNMPLNALRPHDVPFIFSWHSWSESYQTQAEWLPGMTTGALTNG